MTYIKVVSSLTNSVILRSDGNVVLCGINIDGERDVPDLPAGVIYVATLPSTLLFQAVYNGDVVRFLSLSGEEQHRITKDPCVSVADLRMLLATAVRERRVLPESRRIEAILPNGVMLSTVAPGQTILTTFNIHRRRVRGKRPRAALYCA